jgi:hypothetical protein
MRGDLAIGRHSRAWSFQFVISAHVNLREFACYGLKIIAEEAKCPYDSSDDLKRIYAAWFVMHFSLITAVCFAGILVGRGGRDHLQSARVTRKPN